VRLLSGNDGIARGEVPAPETGLWRVSDGTRTALAAAGRVNPREITDLRATDAILAPLVRSTRGGIAWLAGEDPAADAAAEDGDPRLDMPDLRRVGADAAPSGSGWLGVKRNGAYTVTGVRQVSLLPSLAVLALTLVLLGAAWWREGR
jgi:hypothetical protein